MMVRAFLLPALVAAYFQPGDPPQCFEDYQCRFHRFPSDTGLPYEYSWDVFQLCAPAGAEYVASVDPACILANGTCAPFCNSCDTAMRLRFNVCGTVSGPIAPVAESGADGVGDPQQLPLPHSHGVAVQYIEGYPGPTLPDGYGPPGGCADLDTCDQQYNPTCAPGSLNYVLGNNPGDALYTRRANTCDTNGAAYCSPYSYWCCTVKSTPCTKSAEVLACAFGRPPARESPCFSAHGAGLLPRTKLSPTPHPPLRALAPTPLPDYDGSPPNFNLFNEGSPDGLTLSYYGALPYLNDPFPCGSSGIVDPSTGFAPTRTVTIALRCDLTVDSGLDSIVYRELSPCTCACGAPPARLPQRLAPPPPLSHSSLCIRSPLLLCRPGDCLHQVRLRHGGRRRPLAQPHRLALWHVLGHVLAHPLARPLGARGTGFRCCRCCRRRRCRCR